MSERDDQGANQGGAGGASQGGAGDAGEGEGGAGGAAGSPDLAWLQAKERGDAELPPLAPERAAAYDKLVALVGDLPDGDVPAGWNDDVLAGLRAARTGAATASGSPAPPISLDDRRASRARRPLYAALAGAVALAAALLLWLMLRKPPAPEDRGLTVAILHDNGMRASPGEGEAALGDTLLVKISTSVADEVRVYRDDRELVVRCPSTGSGSADARCKLDGNQHVIELPLEAPGRYRAVALRPAPAKPPTGDLTADLVDCKCEPLTAVPVVVR